MPFNYIFTVPKGWATAVHGRTPGLRKLPFSAIAIIVLLLWTNVVVWIGVGIVLNFNAGLTSTAVLAYTLGLRHALDADHISAIDLMTRRLVALGQRPVGVGTWFSLGHSTVVIITSIATAATAAAISSNFDTFGRIGGIIGSTVSSAFLLILGTLNGYILYKLIKQIRLLIASEPAIDQGFKVEGAGCLFLLFKKMFKIVDRSWKMYPLGFMFGLGFDTSSEVALLGIASLQGTKGTSIWIILIFPILFTAGMCLLDTVNGALMLSLYTSPSFSQDPIAVLYYSIALTTITVVVAMVIGTIQLLALILNTAEPSGKFWDGVAIAIEHWDVIGGCVCASFVLGGGLSLLLYKPWRNRVDRKRHARDNLEEAANLLG